MKLSIFGRALPVVLTGCALLAAPVHAQSSDPIKIPLHNWSSQIVGAYIVGKLLNQAGHTTEYVPADSQVVYTSMCEGDIHLVHEVWEGAFGASFQKVVDEGCVIDAATHDAKTREDWWYPAYVEKLCPGLPDWEALNACADDGTTTSRCSDRFAECRTAADSSSCQPRSQLREEQSCAVFVSRR